MKKLLIFVTLVVCTMACKTQETVAPVNKTFYKVKFTDTDGGEIESMIKLPKKK